MTTSRSALALAALLALGAGRAWSQGAPQVEVKAAPEARRVDVTSTARRSPPTSGPRPHEAGAVSPPHGHGHGRHARLSARAAPGERTTIRTTSACGSTTATSTASTSGTTPTRSSRAAGEDGPHRAPARSSRREGRRRRASSRSPRLDHAGRPGAQTSHATSCSARAGRPRDRAHRRRSRRRTAREVRRQQGRRPRPARRPCARGARRRAASVTDAIGQADGGAGARQRRRHRLYTSSEGKKATRSGARAGAGSSRRRVGGEDVMIAMLDHPKNPG